MIGLVMSESALTVWVPDDFDSEYPVINDSADMEDNFRDLLNESVESFTIGDLSYDAADVWYKVDRTAYYHEFLNYCDSGWIEIEMPYHLWHLDSTDPAVIAFIEENL